MAANQASNRETEATRQELLHNSISQIFKACSDKQQKSSNASIFRVPQKLRKLNESAYTPHIVSIGPYHKHDQRLKNMEDQKKSYTISLLSRVMPKPGQTADAAIMEITNKILEKAADARSCYAAAHELNDDVRFAEMLLVDGCFILELLYRRKVNHPGNNDPISCTNGLIGHAVTDDLLLLENQIPMFVLQTLLDFSLVQPYTLPDLIISFFGNMLNFELEIEKVDRTESAAHILGLLHDCYRRRDTAASGGRSISHITKHSAIDLVRAGVRFREDKGRDQICMSFSTSCRFSLLSGSGCNSWFFQFCGRTSFEIPKLHIYDSTESLLRNLIAWEQFSPSMSKTITSYAFLMDTLVNSNDDVEVLEKAGVLQNHLGASEDAKRLFNSICKEVDVGPFIFSEEWQKVEEYRKLKWPRYLASLRRDYFNSPWALISVIAALIIFVLTFIQTVSAILKP